MAEPVLKEGSKGEAVKMLQNALIGRGYDPGAADGIFGPQTETAVKQLQIEFGLVADGIVGARTWEMLGC